MLFALFKVGCILTFFLAVKLLAFFINYVLWPGENRSTETGSRRAAGKAMPWQTADASEDGEVFHQHQRRPGLAA